MEPGRSCSAYDGEEEEEEEDPTAGWFDVKYCRLRDDVPAEEQLFDDLSVKDHAGGRQPDRAVDVVVGGGGGFVS